MTIVPIPTPSVVSIIHDTIGGPYFIKGSAVHRGENTLYYHIGELIGYLSEEVFDNIKCKFWFHGEFRATRELLGNPRVISSYDPDSRLVISAFDIGDEDHSKGILVTPLSESEFNRGKLQEYRRNRASDPTWRLLRRSRFETYNEPTVTELIRQGATQTRITKALGFNGREVGRLYLHRTGRYKTWMAAREAKVALRKAAKAIKEKRKLLTRTIAGHLENRVNQLTAQEEGNWAFDQALRYRKNFPRSLCRVSALTRLLGSYKRAKDRRETPPLRELSRYSCGIEQPQVAKILATLGLPSLRRRGNKIELSSEQKALLARASALGLSIPDAKHFLGIQEHTIKMRFQAFARGSGQPNKINLFKLGNGKSKGTIGLVSKRTVGLVFEGLDAKLTEAEITEYSSTRPNVIAYLKTNGSTIREDLTKDLQFLFDDPTIDTPYL